MRDCRVASRFRHREVDLESSRVEPALVERSVSDLSEIASEESLIKERNGSVPASDPVVPVFVAAIPRVVPWCLYGSGAVSEICLELIEHIRTEPRMTHPVQGGQRSSTSPLG